MRGGEVGWVVYLVGLPFASLLLRPFAELHMWNLHALWAQVGVCLLTGVWIAQGYRPCPSRALAGWVIWGSAQWFWLWYGTLLSQKSHSLPLAVNALHLLILVLFYLTSTAMWTSAFLPKLLRALAYAALGLSLYCGLQLVNLDQFFNSLEKGEPDQFVGLMGNPLHLSLHLALLLPLVLLQRGWRWKVLAGFIGILVLMTRSASGVLAALVGVGVWLALRISWWVGVGSLLAGSVLVGWALVSAGGIDSGRFVAWTQFWQLFAMGQPITGLGPGFIRQFSMTIPHGSPIFHWRHVHLEALQVAIEQGLIGLSLLIWFIWETVSQAWRGPVSRERHALLAVLATFLVGSCFSFPAHLWVTGSLGLVAVCGLRVLARAGEEAAC